MEHSLQFSTPQRYRENRNLYVSQGGFAEFDDLLPDYLRDSCDSVRFFTFRLIFDQMMKEHIKAT
jgi:hypothetical protein